MGNDPEVKEVQDVQGHPVQNNDLVVLGDSPPQPDGEIEVVCEREHTGKRKATASVPLNGPEPSSSSPVDLTSLPNAERTAEQERLAQLELENRRLKRERERLPSHWREMDDHQNVELVDLPMPPGTNAAAPVERDKIPLNNVVAAVMGAFKRRSLHYENGPPGNEQPEEPQIEKSDGKSKQLKRKKRRLRNIEAEEADRVVSLFEKGGLPRHCVTGVQRVQNRRLWRKYLDRREEVIEACNSKRKALQGAVRSAHPGQKTDDDASARQANEYLLFHGANMRSLDSIVSDGFETRVSNLGGALGAGSYFARDSIYSYTYTRLPERADPNATGKPYYGKRPAKGCRSLKTLKPAVSNTLAMLLCRVSLGHACSGWPQMRIAPAGYASATDPCSTIFCVYHNEQVRSSDQCVQTYNVVSSCTRFTAEPFHFMQAFPEYVVYFSPSADVSDARPRVGGPSSS